MGRFGPFKNLDALSSLYGHDPSLMTLSLEIHTSQLANRRRRILFFELAEPSLPLLKCVTDEKLKGQKNMKTLIRLFAILALTGSAIAGVYTKSITQFMDRGKILSSMRIARTMLGIRSKICSRMRWLQAFARRTEIDAPLLKTLSG
jgi:hypothetical protein